MDSIYPPPAWAVVGGLVIVAIGLAWSFRVFVLRRGLRLFQPKSAFWKSLVSSMRGPLSLVLIIIALSIASDLVPISDREAEIVRHILLIGFVLLIAWSVRVALDLALRIHLRRFQLDTADNLLARKHVTQIRILRRVADTLIVVLSLAAVLMTFESVRQYGVSLLASAGAAGIVVGLALQPLLKNIFAGIQLAITQPIRIDDAVIVEGEWGNIEEITSTYVVVRIWDRRRLIVPLSYFIEKPFQNWTREESTLLGTVLIYLDYSTPVDELRREAERIVRSSEHWDGDAFVVQVTDFREHVMEVRVLASARNAGIAFNLRCEIRERLVAWMQASHPNALPQFRVRDVGLPDTGSDGDRKRRASKEVETDEHSQSPA